VSNARNGVNHELLGLVSWGKGCGRSGYPGVYTKITAIYPWLMDVLSGRHGRPYGVSDAGDCEETEEDGEVEEEDDDDLEEEDDDEEEQEEGNRTVKKPAGRRRQNSADCRSRTGGNKRKKELSTTTAATTTVGKTKEFEEFKKELFNKGKHIFCALFGPLFHHHQDKKND
jgi:Trypsin